MNPSRGSFTRSDRDLGASAANGEPWPGVGGSLLDSSSVGAVLETSPDRRRREGQTLTRRDLARYVYSASSGPSRRQANELVAQVLEEITAALASGETVKLHNFGAFNVIGKKLRLGRNPRTGAACPISARRVVVFRPGAALKAAVAENDA